MAKASVNSALVGTCCQTHLHALSEEVRVHGKVGAGRGIIGGEVPMGMHAVLLLESRPQGLVMHGLPPGFLGRTRWTDRRWFRPFQASTDLP